MTIGPNTVVTMKVGAVLVASAAVLSYVRQDSKKEERTDNTLIQLRVDYVEQAKAIKEQAERFERALDKQEQEFAKALADLADMLQLQFEKELGMLGQPSERWMVDVYRRDIHSLENELSRQRENIDRIEHVLNMD